MWGNRLKLPVQLPPGCYVIVVRTPTFHLGSFAKTTERAPIFNAWKDKWMSSSTFLLWWYNIQHPEGILARCFAFQQRRKAFVLPLSVGIKPSACPGSDEYEHYPQTTTAQQYSPLNQIAFAKKSSTMAKTFFILAILSLMSLAFSIAAANEEAIDLSEKSEKVFWTTDLPVLLLRWGGRLSGVASTGRIARSSCAPRTTLLRLLKLYWPSGTWFQWLLPQGAAHVQVLLCSALLVVT